MAAKKKTTAAKKTTKPAATPAMRFVKGAFYEDAKGNLWHCTNPRQKKTPDGHAVVMMQKTEDGVHVGEAGEEYTDMFVRQLTKAELKEYRDACRREREAEDDGKAEAPAEANGEQTTDAQPAKAKKAAPRKKREGKMSCLDAAARVLSESAEPMGAKEMIEAMASQGLWTSPGGATPHATLYAAIIREIAKKGADARFVKTDRGRFTANNGAAAPAEPAPKAAARKGKKTGGKKAAAAAT